MLKGKDMTRSIDLDKPTIGSIGVITTDNDGRLYEIDTIWTDGELDVIALDDDDNVRHVYSKDFWVLVDSPF